MGDIDAAAIIVGIEALHAEIKKLNMFQLIDMRTIHAKMHLSTAEFHLEQGELILAKSYVDEAIKAFTR